MKVKKFRYFAGDFETTVYKGQVHTEVWASGIAELFSDEVKLFHSIEDTFEYLIGLNDHVCVYYHNLKFDGSFWLDFLLVQMGFKQAYEEFEVDGVKKYKWIKEKFMLNNTFKYAISEMGQWYTIIIKVNDKYIEIRDSLKLLPFTLKRMGEGFQTKHQKLDMEYEGFRYAGCEITEKEREYIINDVLVLKEALEIMYKEGHKSLTIGSCCLAEYKQIVGKHDYTRLFPNVYEIEIDKNKHKFDNAGNWIRKSYKGGWCYLVKGKEHKIYKKGTTADVNSLYPSMMSSESGNRYPVGKPTFWYGDFIPDEALTNGRYYFVRIRTMFKIKDGYLPFIQIKDNPLYKGTECLTTSYILNHENGKYYPYYYDVNNVKRKAVVELTLTMTDYALLKEHYDLIDFQIIDGCWFEAKMGIFDEYIEKYKEMKLISKGARRELAKLFLNNLYGKMASNTDSSFKVAYIKDDKTIGFTAVTEDDKKPGYIPVGSAITSYARNFTIRAAQKNYHGVDQPGFIYADTDSIHCDLSPEEIVGIKVHDKNFCCWKLEACWDEAIFVRQKTYIEHVTHEDCIPVEQLTDKAGKPRKPYYNVKCAGMPDRCKNLFVKSMIGVEPDEYEKMTDEEKEFVRQKRTMTDFKMGICVPGKLRPVRVRGGVILVDTPYEMR